MGWVGGLVRPVLVRLRPEGTWIAAHYLTLFISISVTVGALRTGYEVTGVRPLPLSVVVVVVESWK